MHIEFGHSLQIYLSAKLIPLKYLSILLYKIDLYLLQVIQTNILHSSLNFLFSTVEILEIDKNLAYNSCMCNYFFHGTDYFCSVKYLS